LKLTLPLSYPRELKSIVSLVAAPIIINDHLIGVCGVFHADATAIDQPSTRCKQSSRRSLKLLSCRRGIRGHRRRVSRDKEFDSRVVNRA